MQDWREVEFDKIDRAIADVRDEELEAAHEAKYDAEVKAFDAAHPGVCKKCGGMGTMSYYERVDGLGGYMASDICDCADEYHCPYCGSEWPASDESMEGECVHCGWSYDKAGNEAYPCRPEPWV
jgi:hypothetical protein